MCVRSPLHAGEEPEQDASGSEGAGDGDGSVGDDIDEEAVLRLMEIMELPRSAAIELLASYEGDVEAVIISMLG